MNLLTITATTNTARTGQLNLPHGPVETPVFMPVGTVGAMKAINHEQIEEIGYKLILGNTYHLYLRPGLEQLKAEGGLHKFSTWQGNFLTDSGGFQFFSLAPFRKFTADGVKFRSHLDGSYHFFSPELAIQAQQIIGSDIMMQLDVCTPPDAGEKKALDGLIKTTAWAKRCKTEWLKGREAGHQGALFGIAQGNFYKDLRKRSAAELAELDLPGYAIGGLSVGETKAQFADFLAFQTPLLPYDKPKYVMGIGTPDYILEAIELGIDMFDCVYPTRVARNGSVMTKDGLLALKGERFKGDHNPIEEGCSCTACRRYSRSYLRHLVKAGEINALTLLTEHNLTFMYRFIAECRQAIKEGSFANYKAEFLTRYYRD
ncbi:MAG: tRNA guanosine(34) transglycosylase Tgt [Spirochaetaceae bacterium]|nr:tRNA guanosine(34) transglycosylase Tgt [Spirochaetaceae bacterium]